MLVGRVCIARSRDGQPVRLGSRQRGQARCFYHIRAAGKGHSYILGLGGHSGVDAAGNLVDHRTGIAIEPNSAPLLIDKQNVHW